MPWPSDLPQPVRLHPPHQLPLFATEFSSPGPQAYDVPAPGKCNRLGVFASAQDRKAGPRDLRYYEQQRRQQQNQRAASCTPGPIYDTHLYNGARTRLAPSFSRAARPCLSNIGGGGTGPAPGEYYNGETWSSIRGVRPGSTASSVAGTLPRARRMPVDTTRIDEPSPADYGAANISVTSRCVTHTGPSFPHGSVRDRVSTTPAAAKRCQTTEATLAGHEELDRAELQTRANKPVVSFPRSKRFEIGYTRPSSGRISGGDYDAVEASRAASDVLGSRAVGFAKSTRAAHAKHMLPRDSDPELAGFSPGPDVLPSSLTKRGVRLSPQRLDRPGTATAQRPSSARSYSTANSAGAAPGNDPGAYTPNTALTKPNRGGGVSFPRSERFRDGTWRHLHQGEDIALPSTLDTKHGARIGSAKRFRPTDQERECFDHPSAAEYGVINVSPTRIHHGGPSFPHGSVRDRVSTTPAAAKRCQTTDATLAGHEELDRAELQTRANKPVVSFPRAPRPCMRDLGKSDAPAPGDYEATRAYDALHKKGGAAVLYLSG